MSNKFDLLHLRLQILKQTKQAINPANSLHGDQRITLTQYKSLWHYSLLSYFKISAELWYSNKLKRDRSVAFAFTTK